MYPRIFLAVLPALLGAIVPSLALPIQSSDALTVEARSFDPTSDLVVQLSRDVAEDSLIERYYDYDEVAVFTRAVVQDIFPRGGNGKPKLTAEEAQARKDKVKADIAQKQAANAVKKTERKEAFEKLEKNGKPHYYNMPKKVNYKTTTLPNGNEHIEAGYRAIERNKNPPTRIPKQPKTPHPDFAKGEHLTNEKAKNSQAEANLRKQQKQADGRAKYGAAAAAHKSETLVHGNMPGRKDEYHVPGQGVVTGKEVRQGAFNAAVQEGKGGKYPVEFRNQEQGPADNRHQPLPHMVGSGIEYPIQKGGYQPGGAFGNVRGVYQKNAAGGYNLQGVLAHDNTRDKSHPGFNDHIPVPVTHAQPSPDPYQYEG
ncbi:hypothetical protein BDN70DRAFT_447672 [Pholiota conissans]|uniref:Uncharacterized protein n=1 Tax=Pholiota conissans TaxID=109636 RepID=A0A9P5YPF1_9AGAR|nr:hypothetical protein BDN70DRAFT_447672 [Pholiota conissans]